MHKAVINIRIEVHQIMDSGECSGRPVGYEEFKKHGISPSILLEMSGESKHEVLGKLAAWIKSHEKV